jgi:serine/threonine-protein kinase
VRQVQYLNGRYRLIEPLGAGGMSVVWRAYDEVLGRPVAVKLLSAGLVNDPRSRERIRAEARAAAGLSHPHITAVHDYGESKLDGTDAAPFVVMELVDGRPLEDFVTGGPLPWPAAVRCGAEVAAALAAVHARGLVHRDIKPANVMLTERGAKVVDFGISAIAGDPAERADLAGGELLGTPAYLAPERLDGAPPAPATDVYALGLLLYKMLSGRLPWDADTPAKMLSAHRFRKPQPLPAIDGLPRPVADLCLRCLAKTPAERPTASEVAAELHRAAQSGSPAAFGRSRRLRRARPVRLSRPVRAGVATAGVLAGALAVFASCGDGPGTRVAASPPAVAHTAGSSVGTLVGKVLERAAPAAAGQNATPLKVDAPRTVTPPGPAAGPGKDNGSGTGKGPGKGSGKGKDKPKKHGKD